MTDAFRQKLLNWFTSILLLLSAISVMLLIGWFIRAPSTGETPYMTRGAEIAVMFSGTAVMFVVMVFPIIVWHLLDFAELENERDLGRFSRFFSSHTMFLVQWV